MSVQTIFKIISFVEDARSEKVLSEFEGFLSSLTEDDAVFLDQLVTSEAQTRKTRVWSHIESAFTDDFVSQYQTQFRAQWRKLNDGPSGKSLDVYILETINGIRKDVLSQILRPGYKKGVFDALKEKSWSNKRDINDEVLHSQATLICDEIKTHCETQFGSGDIGISARLNKSFKSVV